MNKVKDKEITHPPFVSISLEEQKQLLRVYHKSDLLSYVEQLNDYAKNSPAKFAEYNSHATAIKRWMRRDKIRKIGAVA